MREIHKSYDFSNWKSVEVPERPSNVNDVTRRATRPVDQIDGPTLWRIFWADKTAIQKDLLALAVTLFGLVGFYLVWYAMFG